MSERVAVVVTGLERGGAELQAAALARGLASRGWEVMVFALRLGPVGEELEAEGVRVERFRPWSLLRFRPHVVHAHLFHANLAARVAHLFFPVPAVVCTIHSLAESSRRSGRVAGRDLAYRVTDSLAEATVFVSTGAANRHLQAQAVSAARTHVIPNGVDTERFRPDAERRARRRAELDVGDGFVWLAAGRLMWKKNYPLLLQAMARQPGGMLLVAGTGEDEAALRAAAPENVRFLGARADVAELMNAADALVLSSSVEGLPMVLLEAASSGLPCVATDVGGTSEAVLAHRTGYLTAPGDAEALYHAMAHLCALPAAERGAMGSAAREYALARFDLQAVVGQWEQLYRGLLAVEG